MIQMSKEPVLPTKKELTITFLSKTTPPPSRPKQQKKPSHLHFPLPETPPPSPPSHFPHPDGTPLRITQGRPAMLLRRLDAQHGVVRHRGAEEPARPRRSQEAAVPDAHLTPTPTVVTGGWVISGWGDLGVGWSGSVVERVFVGGGWRGKGGGGWWWWYVKVEGGCVWVNWDLIM